MKWFDKPVRLRDDLGEARKVVLVLVRMGVFLVHTVHEVHHQRQRKDVEKLVDVVAGLVVGDVPSKR